MTSNSRAELNHTGVLRARTTPPTQGKPVPMPTCAFCGYSGKLTGEHVLGDWLTKIGLDLDPVLHGAGPLNRIGRELAARARRSARKCKTSAATATTGG